MKLGIGLIVGLVVAIVCLGLLIHDDIVKRDRIATQLTAVSVKMNCVPVEQSYRTPNKFYMYCGDGIYKVVDLSTHEELLK